MNCYNYIIRQILSLTTYLISEETKTWGQEVTFMHSLRWQVRQQLISNSHAPTQDPIKISDITTFCDDCTNQFYIEGFK